MTKPLDNDVAVYLDLAQRFLAKHDAGEEGVDQALAYHLRDAFRWTHTDQPGDSDLPMQVTHNCWAIYGMDQDGNEVEQKIAEFRRPQDWGHPRWTYELITTRWCDGRTIYINHCHCWTDVVRNSPADYLELFAPFTVQIMWPGMQPEVCGRGFLQEDDFWSDEWGELPPHYDRNPDDQDDDWGDEWYREWAERGSND